MKIIGQHMLNEITTADALALVQEAGWIYSPCHVGGRGCVYRIWNGTYTYEASGIDRWYLIR
jgi:hypothetical protein